MTKLNVIAWLLTSVVLSTGTQGFAQEKVVAGGPWEKKAYAIDGSWSIVEEKGKRVLVLSKDFRTSNGPDLKVFLSPRPLSKLTGKNATRKAVRLGKLRSNKGAQRYEIPASVKLEDFRAVIIHCERFSKLWGGGELPAKK